MTNSDRSYSESVTEKGALAAWYALYELDRRPAHEPDEPLYEKGGVFDPGAWCMKVARAVKRAEEPPGPYKNVACPDWIVERVQKAMEGSCR